MTFGTIAGVTFLSHREICLRDSKTERGREKKMKKKKKKTGIILLIIND